MDKRVKKLLVDVLMSIDSINSYLGDKKVFDDYDKNFLLQDAVERNLITIGEAINLILKIDPILPISDARKIVDMRNKLTHGYDAIDNVLVWTIVIKHLPVLNEQIKVLLEDGSV